MTKTISCGCTKRGNFHAPRVTFSVTLVVVARDPEISAVVQCLLLGLAAVKAASQRMTINRHLEEVFETSTVNLPVNMDFNNVLYFQTYEQT